MYVCFAWWYVLVHVCVLYLHVCVLLILRHHHQCILRACRSYAGLAPRAAVSVRREEVSPTPPMQQQLDGNSTLALPPFSMQPLTVTYFVVEAADQ